MAQRSGNDIPGIPDPHFEEDLDRLPGYQVNLMLEPRAAILPALNIWHIG
jgi:hypothetical protein